MQMVKSNSGSAGGGDGDGGGSLTQPLCMQQRAGNNM